jgi:lysine decarboxylase
LQLGADAMVVSAHKTLPAWSQAALVFVQGDRIDPARVHAGVEATHTTSPAGAILASIDAARALLERDGESLLGEALSAVRTAREQLGSIDGLIVLDGPGVDPLKLTMVLPGTGADGIAIENDLLATGLPVEAAERDTLVAQVSMADTADTLGRLVDAISTSIAGHRGTPRPVVTGAAYQVTPVTVLPPRAAFFAPSEAVALGDAVGRISAELVAPYPPGIPVLAPGEEVTEGVLDALGKARSDGIRIAYAADPTLTTLRVVS